MDYLKCLGPSAFNCKVDISRAFCNIRIDPGDLDLLGLSMDLIIWTILWCSVSGMDLFLSEMFQCYSKKKIWFPNLLNYLDDLIYI